MKNKIIDLTYSIHEGMTTFPVHWHAIVEISLLGRHGIENRETRKITLGTHTGTHCDAPRHFIPKGKTLDDIPLDVFIGKALILHFPEVKPFEEVTLDMLKKKIGKKFIDRIILRFDWDKNWGKLKYYSDHPYLSEDAGKWLVKKGLKLLAMDTPMPDNPKNGRGSTNDSPLHKILLGNDIILVEYLCNLRQVKKNIIDLFVLPLKIKGAEGAPVRCIAIEN